MSKKPDVIPLPGKVRRCGALLLAFASLGLPAESLAQGYVPGRVLVKFADGMSSTKADQVLSSVGARIDRDMPQIGVKVLSLSPNASEMAVARALAQRPGVVFAELDRIVPSQILTTPNDPWFPNQWHLSKIQAPAAWDLSRGSSSVIIAILDSGVDSTHPDLAGLIVPGWNVYGNNSNTADVIGHGTAVAGSAAAMSNNGIGVASVAWNCRLMPVRISDTSGAASYSAMASGLNWAADHGAKVANLSYIAADSATVKSAAQYFMNHGGVVTSASGNYSTNMSAPENPYMLTVGATDPFDAMSPTSNYGSCVDVAAPGVSVWTTIVGGYESRSGTSLSAPIVAGVAALVLSANPSLSSSQVQQIVTNSADDLGAPGWDPYYGWGRVNAYRAVSMAMSTSGSGSDTTAPVVSFSQPSNGVTLQDTFNVIAQASDNVGVTSLTVSVDGVQVASSSSGSCSYAWNTVNSANGNHTLVATAKDAIGNTSSSTVTVSVYNVPDTTPPVVQIVNPTGGAVNTTVSVAVSANDNVRVAKVELYVDGKLTATSSSAPFTTSWNARKAKAGNHVLQTKAYDSSNNSSLSQAVTVVR